MEMRQEVCGHSVNVAKLKRVHAERSALYHLVIRYFFRWPFLFNFGLRFFLIDNRLQKEVRSWRFYSNRRLYRTICSACAFYMIVLGGKSRRRLVSKIFVYCRLLTGFCCNRTRTIRFIVGSGFGNEIMFNNKYMI